MMGSKLDKATRVLAKLVEVAHWIGAVSLIVALVLIISVGKQAVIFGPEDYGTDVSTYGFSLMIINEAGQLNMTALLLFCVGAMVIMCLMAMVFRNVYLILKGSESSTPFTPDNVRMVREIGYFLLAVPVVGLVLSVIARLILGPEVTEVSMNMGSLLVGLVVLCLSRVFARGMELETDVDGLL